MHWIFADRVAMADFCRDLFDLCRATPEEIQQVIVTELGVERLASGETGMNWSLLTIQAKRD